MKNKSLTFMKLYIAIFLIFFATNLNSQIGACICGPENNQCKVELVLKDPIANESSATVQDRVLNAEAIVAENTIRASQFCPIFCGNNEWSWSDNYHDENYPRCVVDLNY